MEASGLLSQTSIVNLARKWECLAGKWLLFVPEWHADALFVAVGTALRGGMLQGCTRAIVSPPGAYGTDNNRYMFGLHAADFTDQRQVMAIGKAFRALARRGLRAPAGEWGELQDDPFAKEGKKVALTFKPDVFSYLNLHRNNPHGIRPSVYSIEL